jgi:DNA-binding Lrp family transcriptional regulator
MAKIKLDKIDLKILQALQEDGRMSNIDLSKCANISAPPCLRRVRNLEEKGVIQSYHARINPAALGYGVTVMAMVMMKSHNDQDLKHFEDVMNTHPQVRECYMTTGECDYIVKVVAKDWDGYEDFLINHLCAVPHVGSVKSMIAKSKKFMAGVPIEPESPF